MIFRDILSCFPQRILTSILVVVWSNLRPSFRIRCLGCQLAFQPSLSLRPDALGLRLLFVEDLGQI